MMMPRTRENTSSINSLAEARNVCSRIFSPDECRVNLNSLRENEEDDNDDGSGGGDGYGGGGRKDGGGGGEGWYGGGDRFD